MFLDEVRVASRLRHPNVAEVLDVVEHGERLLMIMELVDGISCSELVARVRKGSPLPIGIVLAIVAGTARGLHAAHELAGDDGVSLGLVHRDVSPSNILVTRHGVPKLIDFGVARTRDRVSPNTTSGIKGKIGYMAPEQAASLPVDRTADVWGLGATMYTLLSGHPPLVSSDDNVVSVLTSLLMRAPPKPLPPEVPAEVAAIAMRGLAYDPAARFATAAAFAAACEEAAKRFDDADLASFVSTLDRDAPVEEPPTEQEPLARSVTRATEIDRATELDPTPGAPVAPRRTARRTVAVALTLAIAGALAIGVVAWRKLTPVPTEAAPPPLREVVTSAPPPAPTEAPTVASTPSASATPSPKPTPPSRITGRAGKPRATAPSASAPSWKGVDDGF